jgi:hypothetical protein
MATAAAQCSGFLLSAEGAIPGDTVRIGVREGAGMQAEFNIFTDFNPFIVFDSTADLGDLYEKCVRVHR